MKKSVCVAIALALGLTACASMHDMRVARTPDPHYPNVTVAGGLYIVVDQEPIVVPKYEKDFWINWQLPKGSKYTFPRDGIVIAKDPAGEFVDCHVQENGLSFACKFKNSIPGKYKYTIKVMDGPKLLDPLDPIIMNG